MLGQFPFLFVDLFEKAASFLLQTSKGYYSSFLFHICEYVMLCYIEYPVFCDTVFEDVASLLLQTSKAYYSSLLFHICELLC
jgi:hypothetical protein